MSQFHIDTINAALGWIAVLADVLPTLLLLVLVPVWLDLRRRHRACKARLAEVREERDALNQRFWEATQAEQAAKEEAATARAEAEDVWRKLREERNKAKTSSRVAAK